MDDVTLKLLAVSLLIITGVANARKSIHQASPYCTLLTNETMSCDFKDIAEPVQFDKLSSEVGKKIKNVSIKNVQKLSVSGTPCVNLHLDTITEATFIQAHVCANDEDFSMTVINSNINIVPKYVTHLRMESTTSDWLTGDKGFKLLSVLNSRIKTLDINKPIEGNVIARFENCRIDTFQELRIEEQGQLFMVNMTIGKFKRKSLCLTNAPATISMSHFNSVEGNAIQLNEKGTVTLRETVGTITLAGSEGPPITDDLRAPGVPPPPDPNARRPRHPAPMSPLTWIIPTVIASIEAMIIIVNCTNWFPALKAKPRERFIEDGSKLAARRDIDVGQAAVYYGSEDYEKSVNRRKSASKDN